MTQNKPKTQRQKRIEKIQILYQVELLNLQKDFDFVLNMEPYLDAKQTKEVFVVLKNYDYFKNFLESLLDPSWNWQRLSYMLRAILLNACAEFEFIDARIVINEAVEITKIFFQLTSDISAKEYNSIDYNLFKFTNALLETYYKTKVKIEAFKSNVK